MPLNIDTVAVLGAGTMGRGIAHVAAQAGYRTFLFDVASDVLEGARDSVRRTLDKGVQLGKVEAGAAQSTLERLHLATELPVAVAAADLVIEAVPERMELKVQTFQAVSRHCPAGALFASNTSPLSVTEMAGATDRAERFAGMHFFNPVHLMRLVVLVRESPGFVTSRINALIGNEAFRMLEAGVASAEDIDKALKLGLNHPMGPFEMADLVGLDVRYSILQYLHATLGDTYRPSNLMAQYVKAGRLGRKTGRGVYVYDAEGRRDRK